MWLSPSATFFVEFPIESSVGHQVLDNSDKVYCLVWCCRVSVSEVLFTVSYAADMSTKAVPVIFPTR